MKTLPEQIAELTEKVNSLTTENTTLKNSATEGATKLAAAEQKVKDAETAKTNAEAAKVTAETNLANEKTAHAATTAKVGVIEAGLTAAGITVKPSKEGSAVTAEDVTNAVNAVVKTKSHAKAVEICAKQGVTVAADADTDKGNAAKADAGAGLTGLDAVEARYREQYKIR